jgi:hypothetical protein
MMHPLSKAKSKFGMRPDMDTSRSQGTEEGWGGKVGAWFADMMNWPDTRPGFVQGLRDGTIVPFPARIGASAVEMWKVSVDKDNKKISLAQALMDKKTIVFGETDSNLFGDYGDKWDTFFKLYNYAVGKNPIDSKTMREWVSNLPDVLAKTKSMKSDVSGKEAFMFADLDSANTMAWIIANSVGLHRSPRLLLTVPQGMDYEAFVDVILQSSRLVMDAGKRTEIKNMLHAGLRHFVVRKQIDLDASFRNSRRPV